MKKYNDLLTEIVGLKSIEDIIFIAAKEEEVTFEMVF